MFSVGFRIHRGCSSSPILFVIFIDRNSKHSQGVQSVRFGDISIVLLFADDVVLLAPSWHDLACTWTVWSQLCSCYDHCRHLQILGPEKGPIACFELRESCCLELRSLRYEVASEGVYNRARDGQPDWCLLIYVPAPVVMSFDLVS